MKIAFLVNELNELRATQTTSMLIHRAPRTGHETLVVPICGLEVAPDGAVFGYAHRVTPQASVEAVLEELRRGGATRVDLTTVQALLIRTNPARDRRDWAHDTALEAAALLEDRGVFVGNRPGALRRSMSKLMLTRLPTSVLPRTLVTRDLAALEAFLAEAPGDAVIKPLSGTRGVDVFRIDPRRAPNLRQIFDVLTRDGYCVAQHFVPEAVSGDVRVVMLDGRPLQVSGAVAAVRRVPGEGDFRSNIAVGGNAVPAELSEGMHEVIRAIGPQLAAEGLWLTGLDLIGNTVVEVNVFSTGGLHHAEQFYGVQFVDAILDWVEARALGGEG